MTRPFSKIMPRHGTSDKVATASVGKGELIYLHDKECLAVGDGKGGYHALVSVVKGPHDAVYTKMEDQEHYIPIVIKLNVY